jgi:CubicO group peptidase (beta-lactamase class C family)
MHDRVFAPLGMNRTFFLAEEVLADGDYAVGANCTTSGDPRCFSPDVGPVVQPNTYENPWARPAGWAWSSVLDLAKIASFLVHGQEDVLRSDLWTAMTSAQISTKDVGDIVSYGFGVFVADGIGGGLTFPYRALRTVSHGGDIAGFAADITCAPDVDLCFIALANSNAAHFVNSELVALQTLATLPDPSPMPDVTSKPDRYPLYAGTYRDPFTVGPVNITTDGSKLYIQVPVLDSSSVSYTPELTPRYVDEFLMTVDGEQLPLTFITDATGVYTYIRSRPYLAVRTSAP